MVTRSIAGGVPEPDELFGREHLINYLWEQLAGNNILLVAPRRFGKTGVMGHLLKRPRSGYLPVYLEVEELHDPEQFAATLIAALLERSSLRSFISRVKGLPQGLFDFFNDRIKHVKTEGFEIELRDRLRDSWEHVTRLLVTEMEKAEETVLFIIDEFPQLIENINRKHGGDAARKFILWFRSLRIRQKDALRRYRFVLGGSTGIDIVLRRLDAPDKLNDFFRIPVEAIKPEAAESLLNALAAQYDLRFAEDARRSLLSLISPPVPYFLHLFVSQIRADENLKGKTLSPEDVQEVYGRRLLGPTCRAYFDPYRRRLKRYGKAAERAAMDILNHVANAPAGRASSGALYDIYGKVRKRGASGLEFDEIMADLEADWYLVLDVSTNEYHFLLGVMRDWWRRFYRTHGSKQE